MQISDLDKATEAHAAIVMYRSQLRKAFTQIRRQGEANAEMMECLGLLVQLTIVARQLWLRTWTSLDQQMVRHNSKLVSARRAVDELFVTVERKLLETEKYAESRVANPSLVSGPRKSYRTIKSEQKAIRKAELTLLKTAEGSELEAHLLGQMVCETLSNLRKRTAVALKSAVAALKDNAYKEYDVQTLHGGGGGGGFRYQDEGGDVESRWGPRDLQSRLFGQLNGYQRQRYLDVPMTAKEPEDLVARREVMDRFMLRGGNHRSGGYGYRSREDGTHPEKKRGGAAAAYKGKEKRRAKAVSYSKSQALE